MQNEDLIKVNNILISSNAPVLSVVESSQSPIFTDNKSYFDFTLAILNSRKATNTTINNFYQYAKTQGITYNTTFNETDLFIVGATDY